MQAHATMWGAHLVVEVALKVTAAAAKAKHGAHLRQQLLESCQEVLVKPHDVRVAQLLPVQAIWLSQYSPQPLELGICLALETEIGHVDHTFPAACGAGISYLTLLSPDTCSCNAWSSKGNIQATTEVVYPFSHSQTSKSRRCYLPSYI